MNLSMTSLRLDADDRLAYAAPMHGKLRQLHAQLSENVLGAEEPAKMLILALVSNGHVLLQGAPGIGKTTLASLVARSISGRFKRIQFTPDLLPSDIMGYSMYNQAAGEFQFVQGPVFCNILLADEINRTNPRIQSALLECMNEHQVTVDGITRPLPPPFMVIATQNNLYATGTFPLPEPQLDRFLLSVDMELPTKEIQHQILSFHAARGDEQEPQVILSVEEIQAMQNEVKGVAVSDAINHYIIALSEATHATHRLRSGLSPRGSIALMRVAQALAYVEEQPAVYPDHVKTVFMNVCVHRLIPRERGPSAEQSVRESLEDILEETSIPV